MGIDMWRDPPEKYSEEYESKKLLKDAGLWDNSKNLPQNVNNLINSKKKGCILVARVGFYNLGMWDEDEEMFFALDETEIREKVFDYMLDVTDFDGQTWNDLLEFVDGSDWNVAIHEFEMEG